MAYNRLPMKDPRTIAREIPGICDILFPQLTAGTVLYFNKRAEAFDEIQAVPDELVEASHLQHAMLFEIAYARGEQIIRGEETANWDFCLGAATKRQERHFDAILPSEIVKADIYISEQVAQNMAYMLNQVAAEDQENSLEQSPVIQGYQWMSSGVGDFSIGSKLIEIKCGRRNFGSADYRQILMYWLLSYAASIEFNTVEWTTGILINPRRNSIVKIPFDEIIEVTAAGRTKIEVLELFKSVVGDFALRLLSEFQM